MINLTQQPGQCFHVGLSTETKPAEHVHAGGYHYYYELDTDRLYRFSEIGHVWILVPGASKVLGYVYQVVTKTNIGTSYIPVYAGAFNPENLLSISFPGVSQIRMVYIWNWGQTGMQQLRWINKINNDVLYETAPFNVDKDPGDSGWIELPTNYYDTTIAVQWQAKSTVAADDPQGIGYILYGR